MCAFSALSFLDSGFRRNDGVGAGALFSIRDAPQPLAPLGNRLYVDDHHALGLQVVVQRLGAVLAADAAGLDAAEGQLVVAVVE